jgi:hypothetical protein
MAYENKSAIVAYTALKYRQLNRPSEQEALKTIYPLLESPEQREYVLLEDFTCVFALEGRTGLWTTTVPKGCVANGVTGSPQLDRLHPPSWWLHDWHYATHALTPHYAVEKADGTSAVNAFEVHEDLTLKEADDIFEPKALEFALDVARVFFGDAFWAQGLRIGRVVVPEWASVPAGTEAQSFPGRRLKVKPGTSGPNTVYILGPEEDGGGSGCCVVM